MTTKRVRSVSATLALGGALALSSCTGLDIVGDNQSPFVMTVSDIEGKSGAGGDPSCAGSQTGSILYSDVSCLINDDASVTVSILRKNPNVLDTGPLEAIFLQRYEVRFTRSDGRDVEGVDVPFRFTGPLNARLDAPDSSSVTTESVPVNIVRHQAKLEPPLKNIIGWFSQSTEPGGAPQVSGAGVLTTVAEITIHGTTLSGEGLVASARLQVTFADFQ